MARISRARGEGFPRAGQAAGVASVRHGRAAHPPVSWRVLSKKINKKEKILAFCSAIAATAKREVIQERGHKIGKHFEFPIVLTNEIENIQRTSDLKKILITLDLEQDLNRAKFTRRIPSGKGRMRGRNRCTALSAIIVVKKGSPICKLEDSLPGINVKSVDELSVLDLAPGANPIRLTIYSKNAIEFLGKLKCRPHQILEVSKENV
jgi:large subunit ribosomal protein L4e